MASEKQCQTYLFSYSHEGSQCVLEIRADSADDAKRRVARLQYAQYDGELMAKVPVNRVSAGIFQPFLNFLIWLVSIKTR